MEIRRLTESDADSFWALRLRSLREEPMAFARSFEEDRTTPIEDIVRDFRTRWNSPESFILGAFIEGQLMGLVGFYRETRIKLRHKGGIWGMYVAPEARGQGLGRALLVELIARARQLPGLEQLHLSVVTRQLAARKLYESCGFVCYGLERWAFKLGDEYLDDEHLMLYL